MNPLVDVESRDARNGMVQSTHCCIVTFSHYSPNTHYVFFKHRTTQALSLTTSLPFTFFPTGCLLSAQPYWSEARSKLDSNQCSLFPKTIAIARYRGRLPPGVEGDKHHSHPIPSGFMKTDSVPWKQNWAFLTSWKLRTGQGTSYTMEAVSHLRINSLNNHISNTQRDNKCPLDLVNDGTLSAIVSVLNNGHRLLLAKLHWPQESKWKRRLSSWPNEYC